MYNGHLGHLSPSVGQPLLSRLPQAGVPLALPPAPRTLTRVTQQGEGWASGLDRHSGIFFTFFFLPGFVCGYRGTNSRMNQLGPSALQIAQRGGSTGGVRQVYLRLNDAGPTCQYQHH